MITPEQAASAKALKDAGVSWDDLAKRYKRNPRSLRRTLVKMWSKAPHAPSVSLDERAPDTARSVAPACEPTPETPAPQAVRAPVAQIERVFFIPDTHVPFEDGQAWAVAMAAMRAFRPDRIVFLGDFADCYAVSFHPKSAARRASLKEELEAVNARLDEVQALGANRVDFIEGNHEHRLARWVAEKAPELYGMLDAPGLFRISERGWHWTAYRDHLKIGKLHATHDVGHAGVFAHRLTRQAYEGNVILGHTHRIALEIAGTSKGPAHLGIMAGWLGDKRSIDYMHTAKAAQWAHGFAIAYHETDTGNVHVVPVPIVDYRCIIEGTLIDPFRGTSVDKRHPDSQGEAA